jgi:hypothetical protein
MNAQEQGGSQSRQKRHRQYVDSDRSNERQCQA